MRICAKTQFDSYLFFWVIRALLPVTLWCVYPSLKPKGLRTQEAEPFLWSGFSWERLRLIIFSVTDSCSLLAVCCPVFLIIIYVPWSLHHCDHWVHPACCWSSCLILLQYVHCAGSSLVPKILCMLQVKAWAWLNQWCGCLLYLWFMVLLKMSAKGIDTLSCPSSSGFYTQNESQKIP